MQTGSALLLFSALLHATWNALARRARHKESAPIAMVVVCAAASVAWALVHDRGALPPPRALAWTLAAGIAEGGYIVSLGRAFRDAPLGLAYAVSRGGAMLVVWPISIALLGEHATGWTLGGAATLGVGLGLSSVSGGADLSKARLGWSWITAGFIAGYHLAYGRALESGARASTAVAISIVIAVSVAIAQARLRGERTGALAALRAQPLLLGLGGVLSTASFLVFLSGLEKTGAGAALSLRNTSIAFTIVFSALLGERARARQWLGVVMIAGGALLLGR